jgi:hypothetical protein
MSQSIDPERTPTAAHAEACWTNEYEFKASEATTGTPSATGDVVQLP